MPNTTIALLHIGLFTMVSLYILDLLIVHLLKDDPKYVGMFKFRRPFDERVKHLFKPDPVEDIIWRVYHSTRKVPRKGWLVPVTAGFQAARMGVISWTEFYKAYRRLKELDPALNLTLPVASRTLGWYLW